MVVELDREQVRELERQYQLPPAPEPTLVETLLALPRIAALDLRRPPKPDWWAQGRNPLALPVDVRRRVESRAADLNMTPLTSQERALLVMADETLADKSRWTHQTEARDKYGKAILAISPHARSWCAMGALHRAGADIQVQNWLDVFSFVMFNEGSIIGVNDGDGYDATRQVFGAARAYFNVPREVMPMT